jgi:DNA-binding MarR family transcriptional regulator
MIESLSHIQDIFSVEPLFLDIFRDINEQHARILAMMFKIGGYTTLNILTKLVGIAQPTVSVRVQELVDKGFLRKNPELMPIVLVLLISTEDIKHALDERMRVQRNVIEFLEKVSVLKNKQIIEESLIRAFNVIFPHSPKLAKLLAYVYLEEKITREELYNLVRKLENKNEKDKGFSDRVFDSIIDAHKDWFQINRQKKQFYIKSVIPLDVFAKTRLDFIELKTAYYASRLLTQLESSMTVEYESIIPHQILQYPSEINLKLKSCLRHYRNIKIIDNGICMGKEDGESLLNLILKNKRVFRPSKSENKKNQFRINLLKSQQIDIPEVPTNVTIKQKIIIGDIPPDFLLRDFLIFDKNGCLVYPKNPQQQPYYNISPLYVSTVLNFFKQKWSEKDVI